MAICNDDPGVEPGTQKNTRLVARVGSELEMSALKSSLLNQYCVGFNTVHNVLFWILCDDFKGQKGRMSPS